MRANLKVSASSHLDEAAYLMVSLPGTFFLCCVGNLADEIRQQSHVPPLPQQKTIGRLAIAACTPGFLVVLLDRFWQ